ncbi:MAG: hypothetical protein ACNA8P_04255 [Phycisphaerales bacterium]
MIRFAARRTRLWIIRMECIDQNGEGEGLWIGIPRKMSPIGDFFISLKNYGAILSCKPTGSGAQVPFKKALGEIYRPDEGKPYQDV